MPSHYTSPIVCFLDESATDDRASDRAVLGGIVMNRRDLLEFESAWSAMLDDYSVDAGNKFRRHVAAMAVSLTTNPELAQYGVAKIHFEDDLQVPALQAADLVAWATRRRSSSSSFTGPFASIRRLFDKTYVES